MKKLIVLFLVGIILVAFSTASALDLKGKFAVSGNGGLAIPIGDLADKEKGAAKMGFGLYGTAEYFVTQNIGIGGFFGYWSFGTDNAAMKEVMNRDIGIMPDELDIKQTSMTFGAFGKYLFDVHEKAVPYVKVGWAWVNPSSPELRPSPHTVLTETLRVNTTASYRSSAAAEFYTRFRRWWA